MFLEVYAHDVLHVYFKYIATVTKHCLLLNAEFATDLMFVSGRSIETRFLLVKPSFNFFSLYPGKILIKIKGTIETLF